MDDSTWVATKFHHSRTQINVAKIILFCDFSGKCADSSPVVFIRGDTAQGDRERWVPREGTQGEMGREKRKDQDR